MEIQKKKTLNYFIFIVAFLMICISFVFKEIKYIRYLSVLPILLVANLRIRSQYLARTFILFLIYVLLGALLAIASSRFSTRLIAEIILTMIPIVFVVLFNSAEKINAGHIKCFFIITVFFMIIENFSSFFIIFYNPTILFKALITSRINTESHFGFVFGLFFLYFFFSNSKKRYTILAFIFLLIALKRIAIVATIISLIVFFLYKKKKFTKSKKYFFNAGAFISLVTFVYVIIHLSVGTYNDIIKEYTGLSANAFTKGRAYLYETVLNEMPIKFLGYGLGVVTDYLIGLNLKVDRLHSDLLRNIIEYGWGAFSIVILVFNRINIFSIKSMIILIFYWVIMVTDNAFVYFDFLVLFYMIQSNLYDNKRGVI
ncbi:hypothetical protein [Leptobacterium sp. I13]|uniref:hypothetical protein n=1 Tax=Leptobacterium meishanense TaxID=3128904 RepID=UPI0030EBDF72